MRRYLITRSLIFLFKIFFVVIAFILHSANSYSQPVNDNCSNASVITIPAAGFGLGVFTSTTNDLSSATIESGESFAPAILVASLTAKSMWYKFSISSTRSVKVTLAQPGTAITAGNAGFAVYKVNTCLPNNSMISSKLTPLGTFGNTFHPCVDPGDYLIQVTGNNNANGPLYIQLEISNATGGAYDQPSQAYNFGVLTPGVKKIDYSIDCQSIEDGNETCPALSNSSSYLKTSWHVFTTPSYLDYLAVLLASPTGNFSTTHTIGYKLYQGDARSSPISSMTTITACDSMVTSGYYADYIVHGCNQLQPNTTYSIQLFFKQNFNENIRLVVSLAGTNPSQAPEPILGLIPPSNSLGILPSSIAGVTTSMTDYFGCNSQHSIHPCLPSLPTSGVIFNNINYNLSTFVRFRLSTTSNIGITGFTNCINTFYRLYKQDLSSSCSTLDTNNIVSKFVNENRNITCLDPGNYVLQIMGTDSVLPVTNFAHFNNLNNSDFPLCILGNLGKSIPLALTVKTVQSSNHFSLNIPGAFDTINAVSGTMQPLLPMSVYYSNRDTFGCSNTVLPMDTTCSPYNKKAMYREFNAADSGVVRLLSLPHDDNWYNPHFFNKLYRGDANSLALAQNAFSFPQKINGLVPYTECLIYNSVYPQKACIVPGTYSYITFGDSSNVSLNNRVGVQFSIVNTIHHSPATAEDLGDILASFPPNGGSITSSIDRFSCKDNIVPIPNYSPCLVSGVPATKAIYRQFYLNSPASISIASNVEMTLFSGKITNGISSLTALPAPWQCFSNASSSNNCLPAGWYTVISYATGPSYQNPLQNYSSNNSLDKENFITISGCPGPKYNRPYKAAIDTLTNQPFLIQWGPRVGSTAPYPITDTTYTLYTERYNCSVDTPFTSHPILPCDNSMTKVTYYVFKTVQESYIRVLIDNEFLSRVYAGDVRFDSASFTTATPIQPCVQGKGNIQLCNLQPGVYTLVVFTSGNTNSCLNLTPQIYIDKAGYSRFDHANNAYDFGIIPPDSLYHNGKVGDVNPLNALRAPSNDFFYCTTGAQPNDPDNSTCGQEYNSNIYANPINNYLYPAPNAYGYTTIPKRNLWYTFVIDQGGWVKVKVEPKTPNKLYNYRYAVYKSNVNGNIPFSTLVSSGQVDSTLAQGLTFVERNWMYYWYGCTYPANEITFYKDPCNTLAERFYVIVENVNNQNNPAGLQPNSQVEISILLDSVNSVQPLFNHYSSASNIGTSLGSGIYTGQTDNFSCATRDNTDPILNTDPNQCKRTLWYKFSTSVTGHLRYRIKVNTSNVYYASTNIQLLRQVIAGDSTSNGLQNLSNSAYPIYDPLSGSWSLSCISPGTYFLILPGCNQINEYVYPEIQIIEQIGDFCSNPALASLNGVSSSVSTVIIDCHTIGTDYGEFNPTLTCPNGATTSDYKTSWFKIQITGTDTVDVTTYLTENTNALPSDIKYRLMNGDCNAMQERSCVQDAQTQDTYKCLPPGDYYIQVFCPTMKSGTPVTGTIDLHVNAIPHVDTCAPLNNCFANANFIPQYNCSLSDSVTFVNYSTFGSAIQYLWDFGYNNQTSTQVAPRFSYPVLSTNQTYNVTLVVRNSNCNGYDTVAVPVIIPGRPQVNLGRDTTLCNGGSLLLNATSWPGTTYLWHNGSTNPTFNVTTSGTFFVKVTYNGCSRSDTINININPITAVTQTKILCGNDSVQLNSYRGYNENYLWSNGSTNSSIYVNNPGIYINNVSWNTCSVVDSFYVINAQLPFANTDTTSCYPLQSFSLNAVVPGGISYSWQNGSSTSSINVTSPGLYWVQINYGSCIKRDSIYVNVSSPPITDSTNISICQGQIYTLPWGTAVSNSGIYRDTLYTSQLNCDSLYRIVRLTVQSHQTSTINAVACLGQTYTLPWGSVVNMPGIYRDTLHYQSGCDSLYRIINLSYQAPISSIINAVLCLGQTYTLPWGQVVSSGGIYKDTLHYSNTGCDSLYRTVNLSVQSASSLITNPTICAGQSYTLPWGVTVTNAGVYRDTLRYNNTGCDSLYRIVNLTVQSVPNTFTINASICSGQSYTLPWGPIVSLQGIYRDTINYTNSSCDSLYRIVNLTVQSAVSLTMVATICNGHTYTLPWGTVVSSAGIYMDTLHYTTGCDSVYRTVNLTVQVASSFVINPIICSGQTYTLPWGNIVSSSGTYKDTLRYSTGCDSLYRIVNLTVQAPTLITLNPIICSGQTYTLPWGIIVSSSGTYHDTLRYSSGCDSLYRTVNLLVQQISSIVLNPIICSGQSYTLPSGIIVNLSGIYRDTLRYANTGCDSVRRSVNLLVQSVLTSVTDVTICRGRSYILPWGVTVNTSGTYKDTLRYLNTGCDSLYRIVNLSLTSAALISSINPSICAGEFYTLPWGTIVTGAGIYRDTIRTTLGCDSLIQIVTLTLKPKPVISISKSNDIDCMMGTSKLYATGGVSYLWQPGSSLSNPSTSNPVATPTSNTIYKVKVTSSNGCFKEDSIEVKVIPGPAENGFLLPSAFTPNNDGKNDCFGLKTWGKVTNVRFEIYNRLGVLIFKTNDPSQCWNGTYKGEIQPTSVFVYQVWANTFCGPVYRKGTVTLIR